MHNTLFICCYPIGTSYGTTWGNVINYGTLSGDKFTYPSKDGIQCKPVAEVDVRDFIKVLPIDKIDMEKSLSRYISRRNIFVTKIQYDESLETGESYKEAGWHFPLLINYENSILKYRIVE